MHIETSADARRSRRHAVGGDHAGPAAGDRGYLAAAASRFSLWWHGNRRPPALTADTAPGAGLQGGTAGEDPQPNGDAIPVVQYGVGRQPCRCAQINSLLEFSHAVSMQSTVSRLLQLKIYRTSTRSRCTCTRVHVQYKTRYEVYIRVQYFMYSANKKDVHTKDVPVHEKDQSKAKIQQRTYHT